MFGEGAVRLGDRLGVGKSWFSLGFSKFLGRGGGDAGTKEHRINPFRAQPWQARLENIYTYIHIYLYIHTYIYKEGWKHQVELELDPT